MLGLFDRLCFVDRDWLNEMWKLGKNYFYRMWSLSLPTSLQNLDSGISFPRNLKFRGAWIRFTSVSEQYLSVDGYFKAGNL